MHIISSRAKQGIKRELKTKKEHLNFELLIHSYLKFSELFPRSVFHNQVLAFGLDWLCMFVYVCVYIILNIWIVYEYLWRRLNSRFAQITLIRYHYWRRRCFFIAFFCLFFVLFFVFPFRVS